MPDAISARQRRFIEEYIVDGNGTQAAIRAGYSRNTANEQASRLLAKINIRAEVERLQQEAAQRAGVTLDWIMERYKRIANADIRKAFKPDGTLKAVHELDDETAAALSGIDVEQLKAGVAEIGRTTKVRRWDPTKALDSLTRMLGGFKDRVEHSGAVAIENLVNASLGAEDGKKRKR